MKDGLNRMLEEFEWIEIEKEMFGMEGSDYDFEKTDIQQENKRYNHLKREQENLAKRVNMRVEVMSDKVEKEYKNLHEKKKILETDKSML